jgi:hypothetical protein
VFDKLNGVTLYYDENVQVYPIDCVYGIIEVKSALSKAELYDALEKIKAFKAMAPGGAISQPLGGGLTVQYSRPRPFGLIFAYDLSDNSLDSLLENLREWERATSPGLWPNYLCVLGVGVIYHHGKPFEDCLASDQITAASSSIALRHGEDSLFKFYCALHDICAPMNLGPVELSHYYEPSLRVGKYVVRGRFEGQWVKNDQAVPGMNAHLSETALDKVVTWCLASGKMSYGDVLKKQFGSIPLGMENIPMVRSQVYLYNPDNLPGIHEPGADVVAKITPSGLVFPPRLANCLTVDIDENRYVIAMSGFEESDFDVFPSK